MFKDLEHKKTKHLYVEPQVKDAQTIETETQTTNSEFPKLRQEFDKVNNSETEQKSQTDPINLTDDILDEDNPFRNIDTEDIWIEDDLFDDNDIQAIKNILKEIIDVAKPDRAVFDDIDFEPIETITLYLLKKVVWLMLKQIAARKIVKKHRNLARKKPGDVVFLKQVPVHPRDRLARKTKDEVKFLKQVSLHPRERLKEKEKVL